MASKSASDAFHVFAEEVGVTDDAVSLLFSVLVVGVVSDRHICDEFQEIFACLGVERLVLLFGAAVLPCAGRHLFAVGHFVVVWGFDKVDDHGGEWVVSAQFPSKV